MGRVIRASHLYLHQPVAIKILLPNMAESQSTVARFLREAQATVKLRSEHIARVMDVGTLDDGSPFMVMEYLEGHDLNQILRAHGPQMASAVVDLMLQASEGIAEAHAIGIVHRDIKPSNFFITRRPDGSNLLKILDFGISKTPQGVSELTGTQTIIGTPTYMAPEQMRTARSTDPRSDIWSMGVVMYQLLEGRPPFEAETYAELVLKVGTEPPQPIHVSLPPGLQGIVMRCLEKDPKNRIQNVGELARMLAPYASDPLSAQQSADRASRILTTPRGSQPGFPLAGAGGGMTPPALTPKSWSNTNGSSLSGGAGQLGTQVTHGKRGVVIAGVASLCVAAGIGGFFVSNMMRSGGGGGGDTHVQAPASQPADQAPPMDVKPAADTTAATTKPADPTKPPDTTKPADVVKDTKPVEPTIDPKKTPAKTTTTAHTAKTETHTTAKTTKSTPSHTTTSAAKSDDLFNDRH